MDYNPAETSSDEMIPPKSVPPLSEVTSSTPEVQENTEANEAWKHLEQMFTSFDRFLGAQVNRYRFMTHETSVVDVEDLEQHAMIAAYEAWCDKRDKTPRYMNYLQKVMEYHQLTQEEAEKDEGVFAGYIKRKVMWELINVNRDILGYGEDSQRRVSRGKSNTFTESDLIREGEEERENLLDVLSAGILESGSESVDAVTLRNFEKFFHVDTDDMDSSEAKRLRQILYEVTYQAIEEEQREMAKKGSGSYRKVTEQAIQTRAAVFHMIVENVPLTRMADKSDIKKDTLRKERDRMLVSMVRLRPTIVDRVQERIAKEISDQEKE